MALTNGPKLGLLVDGLPGEEHYDEILAQWRGLDALIQSSVIDKDLTAPPGTPADGDCYIVGAAATDDWATHDGEIARYSGAVTAWEFYVPQSGWTVFVVDELEDYRYSGTAWVSKAFPRLYQTLVVDKDLTAPPGSPVDGALYIVGGSATGDWSGHDDEVARYDEPLGVWQFFAPAEGWEFYVIDEDVKYLYDGSGWASQAPPIVYETIVIDCVPEATVIGAGHLRTFHMPVDFTLTEVMAGVATPQATGTALLFDLQEAGVTVFSTKVTIDNTEDNSTTAAPSAIADSALAKGAKMTVIADAVGDGTAKGLAIYLTGYRT
jgi:hypothetical protein